MDKSVERRGGKVGNGLRTKNKLEVVKKDEEVIKRYRKILNTFKS